MPRLGSFENPAHPPAAEKSPERTMPAPIDEQPSLEVTGTIDHELVKKIQPKFLARGGEHIVYEIPGHPEIVAKVETALMARLQVANAERSLPLDTMPHDVLPLVRQHVQNQRERYVRLKEYFGREHVLPMKQSLMRVPITNQISTAIHRGKPPAGAAETGESWAIVRIQKRAPEFGRRDLAAFTAGYAEFHDPNPDQYRRVTRALVDLDDSEDFSSAQFRGLLSPHTAETLLAVAVDQNLRAALRDFVTRTFRYVNETGEILDLADVHNVTVFKNDGAWSYRLIDALYPAGPQGKRTAMFLDARKAVAKAAARKKLNDGQKNKLLNTVNFVRFLNGLARTVGIGEQLRLVDPELQGKVDFLSILPRKRLSA
jgi:hypothetical protein